MKLKENTTLNDYVAVSIPNTAKTVDALGYFLDKFDKSFYARNGIAAFVIKVRDLKDALDEVDLDLDDIRMYDVDEHLNPIEDEEIYDKLAFIYDADDVENDGEDKTPEVKKYSREEIEDMAGPIPEPEIPEHLRKYFDDVYREAADLDEKRMQEKVDFNGVFNAACNSLGNGITKVCDKAANSNLFALEKKPDEKGTFKTMVKQSANKAGKVASTVSTNVKNNQNVQAGKKAATGAVDSFMNTLANSKLFKA